MTNENIERGYKAAWHLLISLVGIWEFRHHRTKLSKVLAVGLILFHCDGTVCDAMGIDTTPQRILRRLRS